jgi:hypothetical protein
LQIAFVPRVLETANDDAGFVPPQKEDMMVCWKGLEYPIFGCQVEPGVMVFCCEYLYFWHGSLLFLE